MGKDGFPAISMTQHAANKYCQWLSAKTGHFYRLPTEAEWEYAARAGTTTAYFWGDDAAQIGDYCWWGKNSDFKYQKVGKKKPNPWGLYDILGNVIEWTLDQYDPDVLREARPPRIPGTRRPSRIRTSRAAARGMTRIAPKLRCAVAPRVERRNGSIQDPQLPKSIWYHTDAQFLGFRIVRPLKTPTPEEMQAYWNSGVEKDDARPEQGGVARVILAAKPPGGRDARPADAGCLSIGFPRRKTPPPAHSASSCYCCRCASRKIVSPGFM